MEKRVNWSMPKARSYQQLISANNTQWSRTDYVRFIPRSVLSTVRKVKRTCQEQENQLMEANLKTETEKMLTSLNTTSQVGWQQYSKVEFRKVKRSARFCADKALNYYCDRHAENSMSDGNKHKKAEI